MHKLKKVFLLFSTIGASVIASAQVGTSSPYSISGLGELKFNGFVSQKNMGGASRALRSEFNYSVLNPASYTALRNTVYNAGAYMMGGSLTSSSISGKTADGNLGYFSMAFATPYEKKHDWGVSFGMHQLTDVGYSLKVLNNDTFNSYNLFKGNGGLSTAYLGGAISPTKGLSVGANFNVNFGNIRALKAQVYPEDKSHFSFSDEVAIYNTGLNLDLGVQYSIQKGGLDHTVGLTYSSKTKLNGKGTRYAETFFGRLLDQQGIVETIDTIIYSDTLRRTNYLPEKFGIAYSISKGDNWVLTAEYEKALWSGIKNNEGFAYSDNERYALGFAIVPKPDYQTAGQYFSKVRYSAGMNYEKMFYNFFGQQIEEVGIAFGLGLPVVKTFNSRTGKVPIISRVNLGLEYTKRGTTVNGLVAEEYLTISLGLNFNDKWFIKRKYQ